MKQEKKKELWGNCDIEKDMSWNMYQILVNTAVSANLIGTICNFCIHGTELPTILCGVCLLMILIIGCAGWITQKVQLSVQVLFKGVSDNVQDILTKFDFDNIFVDLWKVYIIFSIKDLIHRKVIWDQIRLVQ